jgi:hypothetical protein
MKKLEVAALIETIESFKKISKKLDINLKLRRKEIEH